MRTIITILSVLVYTASAGIADLKFSGLKFGNLRSKCPPKPPTISTFDATKYLGKWYEQKRIPASFQLDTSCVRAEYGVNDAGEVTVHNTATKKDGSFDEIYGTAYVPDESHPGELKVKFPGVPVDGDYWILETDYDNYAYVYSCVDFLFELIHFEFAWILTREPNADPSLVEKGVALLEGYGVDVSVMEDTVQNDDCYYNNQ